MFLRLSLIPFKRGRKRCQVEAAEWKSLSAAGTRVDGRSSPEIHQEKAETTWPTLLLRARMSSPQWRAGKLRLGEPFMCTRALALCVYMKVPYIEAVLSTDVCSLLGVSVALPVKRRTAKAKVQP